MAGTPAAFRGAEIGLAVADHDGAGRIAPGQGDHAGQVARVGLRHGKRIAAGEAGEIACEIKLFQQLTRQVLALVGAHCERGALGGEGV